MPRYKIKVSGDIIETVSETYHVTADTLEEAKEKAWDRLDSEYMIIESSHHFNKGEELEG